MQCNSTVNPLKIWSQTGLTIDLLNAENMMGVNGRDCAKVCDVIRFTVG